MAAISWGLNNSNNSNTNRSIGLNDFLEKIEKINSSTSNQHIDTLNFFKVELKEDGYDITKYVRTLTNLNFSSLIQRIQLPEIADTIQQTEGLFGKYPTHSLIVFPTTNELTFDVINTREASIDYTINNWLHEVHSVNWINENNAPYSTIRIEISLEEHTDIKYVFLNCRPTTMKSHITDQQLRNNITREITFAFDYMYLIFPKREENNKKISKYAIDGLKSFYGINEDKLNQDKFLNRNFNDGKNPYPADQTSAIV